MIADGFVVDPLDGAVIVDGFIAGTVDGAVVSVGFVAGISSGPLGADVSLFDCVNTALPLIAAFCLSASLLISFLAPLTTRSH